MDSEFDSFVQNLNVEFRDFVIVVRLWKKDKNVILTVVEFTYINK